MFLSMNDLYNAVIEMIGGCVVTLDTTGKILSFDSRAKEISFTDIVGKNWFDVFVSDKETKKSKDYFCNIIAMSDSKPDYINTLQTKNIEWKFKIIRDSERNIQGILGVGQTETEEAKLRVQLHHADRLATVGQLAAGIAHELNEPLANILGYAQLASKNDDLPEQLYMDLDNIVRFALHAREVVKKVMLFSRQMPPKQEPVNLNKIVEDGLYFTDPFITKMQVETSCSLDPNIPEIIGDPSQLRQVIVNLLVNAVQAMPDGGKINIVTATKDSGISLTVTDTGVGMDEETQKKCFLPFFTTKDIYHGTGLGLSVVHGIVEAHRGTIQVYSQPGKGASFDIYFPLK